MLFPGIKKIAKGKNWHRSRGMVAGLEKGYLVNMGINCPVKYPGVSALSTGNRWDQQCRLWESPLSSR